MFRETLGWWLVVELIGLAALPLAYVLFRRLPDRGYAFAKPVGILLGGYLFWLAMNAHILSNRPGSILWCYLAIAAVSALVFRARRQEIVEDLQDRLHVIIAIEIVFTLGLFVAAYLRSFIPEIDGTEKPMDFMFLNAASRSHYYPPADPWLAGFDVSYYYFGYVLQAMLGKISGVGTSVAFNLGLASTVALAATAAFGLGYNLVALSKRATPRMAIGAGVLAVMLIAVIGNLEGVLEFAKAHSVGSDGFFSSMSIANLAQSAGSSHWYPSDQSSFWWWWRATRMCGDANCITEFPFFSFLLGDMHPHVMAIPFVLTSIAIGLSFWLSEEVLNFESWYANPAMLLLTGILLGGLGFLNTWDLPSFGVLAIVLIVARNLRLTKSWRAAARASAGFAGPLFAVAAVAYLPFYVTFHSQASGLAAVSTTATTPGHAALFWLPLGLLTLTIPLIRVIQDPVSRSGFRVRVVSTIPLVLIVVWLAVLSVNDASVSDALAGRGLSAYVHLITKLQIADLVRDLVLHQRVSSDYTSASWITAFVFMVAFCLSTLALWREVEKGDGEDEEPGLVPLLALTAVASLLILGTEFLFIKDVFGSRLNTVFKLDYQAWLMLGAAGGYGLYWLVQRWTVESASLGEAFRGAWAGAATLVLLGALLYPLGATLSRTNGLQGTKVQSVGADGKTQVVAQARTLDGMAFVARNSPGEIGAIDWMRKRAGQDERLVEGVLGQYSNGGRIAGRSGVPTVIGWAEHEVQWGRARAFTNDRAAAVDQAYSTDSLADAMEILRKYSVTYVVVGTVERAKYPAAGLQKFDALQTVYSTGDTNIYRLPAPDAGVSGSVPQP